MFGTVSLVERRNGFCDHSESKTTPSFMLWNTLFWWPGVEFLSPPYEELFFYGDVYMVWSSVGSWPQSVKKSTSNALLQSIEHTLRVKCWLTLWRVPSHFTTGFRDLPWAKLAPDQVCETLYSTCSLYSTLGEAVGARCFEANITLSGPTFLH